MDKTISRVTSILIIVATVTLFVIMGIGLLRADQFGTVNKTQVYEWMAVRTGIPIPGVPATPDTQPGYIISFRRDGVGDAFNRYVIGVVAKCGERIQVHVSNVERSRSEYTSIVVNGCADEIIDVMIVGYIEDKEWV
jgi:hypothetical protein